MGLIWPLCGLFFPQIHNSLNYNRLLIILISLLFWVRVNPNPETVAEPTLICRSGADPTRQAAAIPKTSQAARPFRQPCHPALLSAHLVHPPVHPPAHPLPACPFVCQRARLRPPSASSGSPSPLSGGRDRGAHTTPRRFPGHGPFAVATCLHAQHLCRCSLLPRCCLPRCCG